MDQLPLEILVEELDSLLSEESAALRTLNHDAIEEVAQKKIDLLRRLGSVSREGATKETLKRVAVVRQKALNNQLLMVHARDLIRGVLDAWNPPSYDKRGTAPPRLLAVRG